jgi:hypothetical protein
MRTQNTTTHNLTGTFYETTQDARTSYAQTSYQIFKSNEAEQARTDEEERGATTLLSSLLRSRNGRES